MQTTVKKGVCTIERGSHACWLAFPGACVGVSAYASRARLSGTNRRGRPYSDVSSC